MVLPISRLQFSRITHSLLRQFCKFCVLQPTNAPRRLDNDWQLVLFGFACKAPPKLDALSAVTTTPLDM